MQARDTTANALDSEEVVALHDCAKPTDRAKSDFVFLPLLRYFYFVMVQWFRQVLGSSECFQHRAQTSCTQFYLFVVRLSAFSGHG